MLWSGFCNFPWHCSHHVSLRRSFVTLHGNKSPSPPSTCISSSLPDCRWLSHWHASCRHRSGRLISRLHPPHTHTHPPLPPSAQTAGRGRRRKLTQGVLVSLPHLTSRHKPSGVDINSRFRVGGIKKKVITKPDRMCWVKWHRGPELVSSSDGTCSLAGLTRRQSQLEPQRLRLQTYSWRLLQIRLSVPISFPIKAILSQSPLRRSLFALIRQRGKLRLQSASCTISRWEQGEGWQRLSNEEQLNRLFTVWWHLGQQEFDCRIRLKCSDPVFFFFAGCSKIRCLSSCLSRSSLLFGANAAKQQKRQQYFHFF